MTSTERLAEEYGIITRWENGRPFFSHNFRSVVMTRKYKEVSKLMEDIEKNERPSLSQPIIVEVKRCLLVLYPHEILHLVLEDSDLCEKALRRGKAELRMRNVEKRLTGGKEENAI